MSTTRFFSDLPDPEDLRCFVAAAECLNFRQAARRVGLVPTALSQRIKKLESSLGEALFVRTTRSVSLTQAGSELLPLARRALETLSECRSLSGTHRELQLRIGSRFELAQSYLSRAWPAWEAAHPNITLELYVGSGPDILSQLSERRLDAVITSAPVARSDWRTEVLHPETYCLVASPALLTRVPFKEPKDAARHTLLDVDASLPLARYLLSVVPELSFGDSRLCGAGGVVHELALAGAGAAVLPEYMVQKDIKRGVLKRLLPKLSLLEDTFRLVFPKETLYGAELKRLARFLADVPLS